MYGPKYKLSSEIELYRREFKPSKDMQVAEDHTEQTAHHNIHECNLIPWPPAQTLSHEWEAWERGYMSAHVY